MMCYFYKKNYFSAVQMEPNDHLCEYYLGLQLAQNGCITEAITHLHTALALQPERSSTLHLLALLLSANRQHEEALQVVDSALLEFPDCLNLMYVKAHLELHEEGGEVCNFLSYIFQFNIFNFSKHLLIRQSNFSA